MTGSRLAVLFAVSLLSSCARAPERLVTHQQLLDMSDVDQHRLGSLQNAVVHSNSPFEVRDAAIHGDRRPSLVLEDSGQGLLSYRNSPWRRASLRARGATAGGLGRDPARGRGWRSHSSRGLARRKRLGRASHRPQPLRWAESRARALRRRSTRDGDSRQPRGGGSGVACGGEKAQRTGLRGSTV